MEHFKLISMFTLRYLCVQDGMKGWAPEQLLKCEGDTRRRKVRRMKEVELTGFNSQIHRGKSKGDSWVE